MDIDKEAARLTFDRDLAREVAALVRRGMAEEREACAAMVDAWPDAQRYTADRATYGVEMATHLADAIRARSSS